MNPFDFPAVSSELNPFDGRLQNGNPLRNHAEFATVMTQQRQHYHQNSQQNVQNPFLNHSTLPQNPSNYQVRGSSIYNFASSSLPPLQSHYHSQHRSHQPGTFCEMNPNTNSFNPFEDFLNVPLRSNASSTERSAHHEHSVRPNLEYARNHYHSTSAINHQIYPVTVENGAVHEKDNALLGIPSRLGRQTSDVRPNLVSTSRSVSLTFSQNSNGNIVFDPWKSPGSAVVESVNVASARPQTNPSSAAKTITRRHCSTSPRRKNSAHLKNTPSLSNLHMSRNNYDCNASNGSDDSDVCPDDTYKNVLEPQHPQNDPIRGNQPELYDAYFKESDKKLGMLLERKDEWRIGSEQRKERAMVSLVVDMGPAEAHGVTVGSKVVAVNDTPMENATYNEVLDAIKFAPRPMRVTFSRGSEKDDANVGMCFYKTCAGLPRNFKVWKKRFFVMGGAVARPNVLQLYVSKQAFDHVVIAVFQGTSVKQRIKVVKLGSMWSCSPIRVKQYDNGPCLKYFHIKKSGWHFKQMNFASTSMSDLERLREQILKVCHLS